MRSRLVASTHSALPDVTADQHHTLLHAANHQPGATDAVDNNAYDVGLDVIGAILPNSVVTGSGANAILALGRGQTMITGVTNPSSCSHRIGFNPSGTTQLIISRLRRFAWDGYLADVYANSNSMVFMTDENVDTIPSATARHIGFKNLVGVVTFSTADGAVEQTTDISAFVVAAAQTIFLATFDGVTARCYVNGTLRATHATNVPAAGAVAQFRAFINNNASANSRQIALGGFRARFAAT